MNADFWVAVAIRSVLLVAAVVNLVNTYRMYHLFHDARGLRALVMGLSIFGGTLALAGSSQAIRAAFPQFDSAMRVLVSLGITMFCIGLLWSVWTWRPRP